MPARFKGGGSTGGGGGAGTAPAGAAVMVDAAPTFTARLTQTDANTAPSDTLTAALVATYTDSNAGHVEALTARPSGYVDANTAPGDSSSRTVRTWANSNTTSGTTAPTNPTNAQGSNDGTVAQCKAGGLTNGTSTLVLTIPVASVATGTQVAHFWYATTTGLTDTFTMSAANTAGTPSSITLPQGNFLTTPHTVALTTVGSSYQVTFTHAASTPATGGNIQIDAVAIVSTGSF